MASTKAAALSHDAMLAETASFDKVPRILLHCCCAPCTSYVLEYLSSYFKITLFYYNPNIQPCEEYDRRASELQRLLELVSLPNKVDIIFGDYDDASFEAATVLYRDEPEGSRRCRACFELRLAETANQAKEGGFDYFTTTLSVSPHKDAVVLNEIGSRLAGEYGIKYLQSDFKKRDGYKRSIELSKQYGLYRQSYCGCERSKRTIDKLG